MKITKNITKMEADAIVRTNENFYCKEHQIKDTKIFVYNYRLNNYKSFESETHREMRGLTITVENAIERVFPSIRKMWNLNENPGTLLSKMLLEDVKYVYEKIDGSLIQPILVGGDVIMKTKQGFTNTQALMSQEMVDTNADLLYFILSMFEQNWYPLFELTGPDNKIVLDYEVNSLKLISLRNDEGYFIDISSVNDQCPVGVAKKYDLTLNEIIDECKEGSGFEGYVVRFKSGETIKIKSLWYVENHRLVSDSDRNVEILKMSLTDTLDDVLSIVPDKKRTEILQKQKQAVDYFNHYVVQIEEILKKGIKLNYDRKQMATNNKPHPYFGVIMSSIGNDSVEDIQSKLSTAILKKYNKEEKAKQFFIKN